MPNINITLPDDLHKQLKIKALLADKPLKDFFIETLERRAATIAEITPASNDTSSTVDHRDG